MSHVISRWQPVRSFQTGARHATWCQARWRVASSTLRSRCTLAQCTRELLARGQERYNIYCTPCHDTVGTGHGMIVRRGFPNPPSYHIPRLRQAPIGHFFVVMTSGYGAMPEYAKQVAPQDRWAIVADGRAMQLSEKGTRTGD